MGFGRYDYNKHAYYSDGTTLFPFPIKVAGITFYVKDASELDGDIVKLERDPGNVVHSNAVSINILGPHGVRKIGHVPRELADNIKDEELPRYGFIVEKGEPPYLYARIRV